MWACLLFFYWKMCSASGRGSPLPPDPLLTNILIVPSYATVYEVFITESPEVYFLCNLNRKFKYIIPLFFWENISICLPFYEDKKRFFFFFIWIFELSIFVHTKYSFWLYSYFQQHECSQHLKISFKKVLSCFGFYNKMCI